MLEIRKKTGTANTTVRKGRKVEYIAIHYTAGVTSKAGTAANTAAWFANPSAKASADYIVDDGGIVQYNPDPRNRYCWAVGGSKYKNKGGRLYGKATNANTISIELCSSNRAGKATNANDGNWYFTDAVVDRGAKLVRHLMAEYGIDGEHVIRHYDVNGKPCPGIVGWNAETGDENQWDRFRERIGAGDPAGQDTPLPKPPFSVRVKVPDLNYRADPSMVGQVLGQTGKGVFTITQVQDGWGKLKSGKGWICLEEPDYVEIGDAVQQGSNPAAQSQAKKTVDEIAKEVISGKWGNGDERKSRLKAAGYDYGAVQKKVRQLLG